MKTIRTGLAIAALAAMHGTVAQDWTRLPGGNVINANEWLGAAPGSTIPLSFETRVNQPMFWSTNSVNRMRFTETITTGTINGYNNLDLSGHLGIGLFTDPQVATPYTYLHINHNGTEETGYRSWMKAGMYITDNSDMMYVGTKPRVGGDRNDAVINWSDNLEVNGQFGPDVLSFIFTRDNAGGNAASLLNGLELARIVPDPGGNQGYFGIGDWFTAGAQPTERLDVLNGRVRIRALPADATGTSTEAVVVNMTTGVLEHRPLDNCEWTMATTAPNHVYTAVGTADPNCPDRAELVGIGTAPTAAKLHIVANMVTDGVPATGQYLSLVTNTTAAANGIIVKVEPSTGNAGYDHVAVNGSSYNGAFRNTGLIGRAYINNSITNTNGNRGILGESLITAGTVSDGFGVCGTATAAAGSTVTRNRALFGLAIGGTTSYGLYSDASGATTNYGIFAEAWGSGTNWAGWFQGKVHITGAASCTAMAWTSDANLKTDVQVISGAMDVINQLRPTTYLFEVDEHPDMGLPEGLQRGLIAQEVAEVMPDVVHDLALPARVDPQGNEIPAVTIKTINYIGFIPMLIAAAQEQQVTLAALVQVNAALTEQLAQLEQRTDDQEARLTDMQEMLAACCNAPTDSDQRMRIGDGGTLMGKERDLLINPNPFVGRTTLYYTLERSGRMQLLANSADGKQLRVLHEANMEAGQYQHEWHTSDMSPGVYYVTLLLDGEPIVKKAVKVQR